MNTKRLLIASLLFTIMLAACGGAAPTQIASATQVAQYYLPAPTQAPAPTQPVAAAYPTPAATPADMFFQNYGVNPFVDTTEDHLSTFALDVDTASYTLARRYVTDGQLPPADSIRVEEFVNYFKQDYPIPPDVAVPILTVWNSRRLD